MRRILSLAVACTMIALVATLAVPALADDGGQLSEGDAKKILKRSDKSLKKAQNALQQDNPGLASEHAARYAETMSTLADALARREIRENDMNDVIERVDDATLKHESKLLELLDTAPEQARAGLMKALEASRAGHEHATNALIELNGFSLPNGVLDRRAAESMGKRNDALLKGAERARKRGDDAAVGRSVDRVASNLEVVNQAMASGAIDNRDAVTVLDRVNRNTRRAAEKLQGLYDKVPEQAWPAIDRALAQSARGREESSMALQRSRAANSQSGWPGMGGAPAGAGGAGHPGGRPGNAGPPAGRGPGGRPGPPR